MMFGWSRDTLTPTFLTVVASIPLALAFARDEIRAATPFQLGGIAIVGIAVALAGASVGSKFRFGRFRAVGPAKRFLFAGVGGLAFAVAGGGAGILAAEFSLWA